MSRRKTIPSVATGPRRKHRVHSATALQGRIDQSVIQGLVGYNIRRAELHMRQAFDSGVGESGLRPSEFSILALIRGNPLATQAVLGRALNIRRPNMVVLIEGLERRRLILRARHEYDGRMHILQLSAKGKALLDKALRLSREGESRATRCWTARERTLIISLLRRLYEED